MVSTRARCGRQARQPGATSGRAARPRRARWSWACSTSRRIRFPTAARFLDPHAAIAHARRMVAEGADILDIGAEFDAALWRRGRGAGSKRSARGSTPVLPAVVALGVPGLDRHHEGGGRRLGARRRAPRSSTTSGACSAIPTWRASSPNTACRSSSCTTATRADPRDRHHGRHRRRSSRARSTSPARAGIARERIVLDPGIGFGKTPEQSITCIARLAAIAKLRPAAPGRRLAQALHPYDRAVASPIDGSAARSRRISWRSQNGAAIVRAHDVAETVQALRGRRGDQAARDERHDLRHRACCSMPITA